MLKATLLIPFLLFLSLSSTCSSSSSDTLSPSQSLARNQTLISAGQKFELGFFSPGGANKLYLGIWYFNLPVKTIVWVANRDSPARSSSVSLKLETAGQILLTNQGGSGVVWSSNQSNAANPVLQLLDSGNLVVREFDDSANYIWQSFDYPTDTLLPGQRLGWDKNTGLDRYLTSWRSANDPSSGNYSFRLDRAGDPEIYMLNGGTQRTYRSGPWVGQRFSGVPEMKPSQALNFTFEANASEAYYMFNLVDRSIKSRLMVDPAGILNRFTWVADRAQWNVFWFAPKDQCDDYMVCGPYGVCDAGSLFVCGCPQGFGPSNPSAWGMRDGSDGCVRRTRLECGSDGFVVLRDMKLPESGAAVVDDDKSLDECGEACRKDCNCTAYANRHVAFGSVSGCVMWRGDLRDMRTYSQGGQDLYIRVAAADLVTANSDSNQTKKVVIGVGVLVAAVILVIAIAIASYFIWRRKQTWSANVDQRVSRPGTTERSQDFMLSGTSMSSKRDLSTDNNTDDLELPLYDFDALAAATDNFSDDNKLGQGGFGRVYKGVFVEGEDVAVKRLSKESGQGVEEFKNELNLIAKLQHRNLVRLLGCCVEREEKMLVYEYLSNRSLDSVLFHKERCSSLDWQRRFNIICGIARGLVYLHHDSRFRIIHRDLKASNVLLDRDMKPKISDFGMARIFGGDETEANNTRRVVGTYGYMAPEYAMDGSFSIKSDVFSFGVLVLEIITGKKNRGFYNSHHELNLLGYAWKMWREGKGTELVDPSMGDSYSVNEVLRCVQVGLLCVQERAEERPAMSSVILLLSSESACLPQPKIPGFCLGWKPSETDSSSSRQDETFTVNQVTVTAMLDGR